MIRKLMFASATASVWIVAAAAQEAAPAPSDPAARFGAREGIEHISLSPDGRSIAFLVPDKGRGNALYTAPVDQSRPPARILIASGAPEKLRSCEWVSDARLLCNITILRQEVGTPYVVSRLVAIDAGGGNFKIVSKRESDDSLGRAFGGGNIVDLFGGGDDSILVSRVYVPEARMGSNVASRLLGLGVDRVDTRTLEVKRVEAPRKDAIEYISDGRGRVRIMGLNPSTDIGYMTDKINYYYRTAESGEWRNLGQYSMLTRLGFNPYAVDSAANVVYGIERTDGRDGLYQVKLDGSLARSPVYLNPEVDVDSVIRLGRSRRVVGATYVTDRRKAVYFDADLKALHGSLSRAIPGAPLVHFAGATLDEKKLLVWAGGDVDPGHYYLFDRTTKQMQRLIAARPELDGVALAPVKAVGYRAADGTLVPAYLTLPPGSAGRNIPAIVLPHGGPASRDEWGFDWLAQYFANRGYAVLQPNFRGSSGYGDAWFRNNGYQSWKVAIGDVTDAGRWLVSQGIADPKKLGIVGWSYGGYAALQSAVVAPDLFRAVVVVAPVTDLAQLRTDSMKYTSGLIERGDIGSGPHLREGSPAQNAARIRAPVLMFHGTLDSNVLIGQSTLMKERLSDAGKRVELVVYPGLDHGLADSTSRADMLRRADQFLRANLGM